MFKIAFLDFWKTCEIPGHGVMLGFNEQNNIFLDMVRCIRSDVVVTPPEHADVLFYSVFGNENQRFPKGKVKRIFYTGENVRPNFAQCDYSLTFDFDTYGGRNIRFPLWMMQIDWFGRGTYDNPKYIFAADAVDGPNPFKGRAKTGFCCSVFNNQTANRLEMCAKISEYKRVDIFGKQNNNWFFGEDKKLQVISGFKFNLCFENIAASGYNTEKLIHARVAGCIPLYWGASDVVKDFNSAAFVNFLDYSPDEFVGVIKMLDRNETLYRKMLNEPLFLKPPQLSPIIEQLAAIL